MDKNFIGIVLFLTFGICVGTLVILLQMKTKINAFAQKLKI